MKKINIIPMLLTMFALVFSSCVVDDDHPVLATAPDRNIKVSLNPGGTKYVPSTVASDTLYIKSTSAFSESAMLEYTRNGSSETMVLPGTSVPIVLDIVPGSYYSYELNNITVENAVNNKERGVIDETAKTANIIGVNLPSAVSTHALFILSWANLNYNDGNGGNDLDLFGLYNPVGDFGFFGPDTWGYGGSWDFFEIIAMPITDPDGSFIVATAPWIGEDETIPVTVTVIYPNANPGVDDDRVETYNSVIHGSSGYSEYDQLLKFTKSGITFTIDEVLSPAVPL